MLSLLLTAVLAVSPGKVEPRTYQEAYQDAQENGRPLMVVVSSDACPACQLLKSNTISPMKDAGELAEVNVVVVNKDEDPGLASRLMRGRMIPQVVVYSQSTGTWKRRQLTGYQTREGVRGLIRWAVQTSRLGT